MLVLSRKRNEGIRVADDIHVVVVEIRGDKVRLGVQAPPDVPVYRDEVYEAIRSSLPDGTPTPPLPVLQSAVAPESAVQDHNP